MVVRRWLALGCTLAIGCGFSFTDPQLGEDESVPLPGRSFDADGGDEDTPQGPPPDDGPPPTPTDAGKIDGGGDASPPGPKKVFVSSALRTGNIGGIAGGDALCQQLATAKGFTGKFIAWLSVAGTNAGDRITAAGPWVRVDNEVVATTKAQLISGNLAKPINKDENGATPPAAEDRVWTATGPNGAHVAGDCGGWTSTAGGGRVGEAEQSDGDWTALVDEACTEVNRVYCFEQ